MNKSPLNILRWLAMSTAITLIDAPANGGLLDWLYSSPKGIYQTADDSQSLNITSSSDLEFHDSSGTYPGTYKLDGNSLRAEFTISGTPQVFYFTKVKEGWVQQDGTAFFSSTYIEVAHIYLQGSDKYKSGDLDGALVLYRKAADQGLAMAQCSIGEMYGKGESVARDYSQALIWFQKAADQGDAVGYNDLAWILATCPQDGVRNGTKAVEAATLACKLTQWKAPFTLDTLAAAYAEAGDFDNAVKWESQYLKSPNLSETDTADAQSRLALYQAHKTYHEDQ